jgi:cytochrome oxidase Cu insertion factor (SCO1/SenC/PrrC family)
MRLRIPQALVISSKTFREVSMLKLLSVWATVGVGTCAMAAVLSAGGQAPQGPELKVGDKAPDFALPGSDGKVHKLSDYKGKTVVLAWFPKAFTGG